MQKFLKNDWAIVFLIIFIFLIFLPYFYLHQGLLSVDTGREFYLSQQTALGQVLYKDIFNIYGPFSYQFNGLLFHIFGEKIKTLYISGLFNSILILGSLYFLSREFLNKKLSFLICILTMFSLVFNTFLYNSNITYSYAIIYALTSFLMSLLFLIKYVKTEKPLYAYISSFLAGLSILNKYEFILYPIILIYVFTFLKPLNFKEKFTALISFISIPLISLGYLFIQGLNINDLKTAFSYMTTMANSESMHIFYTNFGNFFNPFIFIQIFLKNPLFAILGLLPITNLILFLIYSKKIFQNKILFIFGISSIASTLKFISFLNIEHMGIFLFPLCILTTLVLSENFFESKKLKYILLIGLIFVFSLNNFASLRYKNFHLETSKGNIYTFKKDGQPIKYLSDYIIKNTNKTDKIVILPEGTMINFITDRRSDNIFHSLSPLFYTDTFGEEKVISNFKQNPTDYFIILPLSTIEYGSEYFCDYASNFCEMIEQEYNLVNKENNIKIYKRKNIK